MTSTRAVIQDQAGLTSLCPHGRWLSLYVYTSRLAERDASPFVHRSHICSQVVADQNTHGRKIHVYLVRRFHYSLERSCCNPARHLLLYRSYLTLLQLIQRGAEACRGRNSAVEPYVRSSSHRASLCINYTRIL